jgi:hypothetical protein
MKTACVLSIRRFHISRRYKMHVQWLMNPGPTDKSALVVGITGCAADMLVKICEYINSLTDGVRFKQHTPKQKCAAILKICHSHLPFSAEVGDIVQGNLCIRIRHTKAIHKGRAV